MRYLLILLIPLVAFASTEFIKKDRIFFGEGTAQDYQFFFDVGSGSGNNPYMMWDESEERIIFPYLQVNSTTDGSRPWPIMTEAQRDAIATPGSGDTVYNTDKKQVNVYDGSAWKGVGGGGAGDVENNIADPGFDNEEDIFTHTIGSGVVQATGGHLDTTENPSPYVSLQTGTTHDHYECRTFPVGVQYEVGCFIKSTLNDIDLCFASDASTNQQCNNTYDGSNQWKYVFQRHTPTSGQNTCLRITSPSSANIEVDSCRIGEVKFSTAELSNDTDWKPYTPTLTGFGTTSNESFRYRRDGTDLLVSGRFTIGTGTAVTAQMGLPSGLLIDLPGGNLRNVGSFARSVNSAESDIVIGVNGNGFVEFGRQSSGSSGLNAVLGNDLAGDIAVNFRVPIQGWTANSTNILAQGKIGTEYYEVQWGANNFWDGTVGTIFTFDISQVDLTNSNLIKWNDVAQTRLVAKQDVVVSVTVTASPTADNAVVIYNSAGAQLSFNTARTDQTTETSTSLTKKLSKGDFIYFGVTNPSGRSGAIAITARPAEVNFLAGIEDIGVAPALYGTDTSQNINSGAATKINYEDVQTDKDSLVTNPSTNWKYVVPSTGVYEINAAIYISSIGFDPNEIAFLRVYVNGTPDVYLWYHLQNATRQNVSNLIMQGSAKKALNKGDEVEIYAYQESGSPLNMGLAPETSYVSITKEEATLSAVKNPWNPVVAEYTSDAGQTINYNSETIVNFEDKIRDTHNAVTTGASWKFTAPYAGVYHVNASIQTADKDWVTTFGGTRRIHLFKNGSFHKLLDNNKVQTAYTNSLILTGGALVTLNKDDYIHVAMYQDAGSGSSSVNLTTSSGYTKIDIHQVKLD